MVQDMQTIRAAFIARLKEAASDAGFQEWGLGARLAKITKRTPKAVSKWMNLESMPERDAMLSIADAFGVRVDWLEHGQGEKNSRYMTSNRTEDAVRNLVAERAGDYGNVQPTAQPSRKKKGYPLISWVAAGAWAESHDNLQPGDAEEWIESEAKAGENGYWLEVHGDSMLPSFPEGTRILVQPEGFDLVSGKFYVALLYEPGKQRETTFKQYVRDAGREYLIPLNKDYKPLQVTENVRVIGRVIDLKPPKSLL